MRVAKVARSAPEDATDDGPTARQGRRIAEALMLLERDLELVALAFVGRDPKPEAAACVSGAPAPVVIRLLAALAGETTWRGALLGLARRAIEQGRHDEAAVFARAALGEDPHDPEALTLAGLCEVECGHKAQAKALLTRAVRIARKVPHQAESMRQAQRLLLRLHFG